MKNIDTYRKALVESMEKVNELLIAYNNAVAESKKAWGDYLEFKNRKLKNHD